MGPSGTRRACGETPRATPMDAPTALAVATVETGEVVNAEGTTESTGPTLRPGRVHASHPGP